MQGQPQRAAARMDQIAPGRTFRSGAARLELGTRYPIALELDRMLLSRRSIEYVRSPRMAAILFGPEHVPLPLPRRAMTSIGAGSPDG